jgi:gamma-glutamylcyclotransferase (GGCT)/AIG2-like uncharacterized protein YtfP/GNAT superfamily N-acetyltransferase
MTLHFELSDQPDDPIRQQILAPLVAFNESQAGPSQARPLVITVRDAQQVIVGGLWGYTGYGWLFVQLLVVPPLGRGQGTGRQLMAQAEAEALARGCHSAWLDTHAFQAKGFYERLGYQPFGELPNYPLGFARHFMQKRLTSNHLVFVFGTLKQGFPNFATNQGQRVPGEFETTQPLPLHLVGDRHSPWLFNAPGQGHRVRGEVFTVDAATLLAMDRLERVSEPDGYRRETLSLARVGATQGQPIEAMAYLKPASAMPTADLRQGPLGEYTLAHSGLYRPRG